MKYYYSMSYYKERNYNMNKNSKTTEYLRYSKSEMYEYTVQY